MSGGSSECPSSSPAATSHPEPFWCCRTVFKPIQSDGCWAKAVGGRGQQQHWQRTSVCPPVFQWPSMAYLIHSEEKHSPLPHLNLLKIIFSVQNWVAEEALAEPVRAFWRGDFGWDVLWRGCNLLGEIRFWFLFVKINFKFFAKSIWFFELKLFFLILRFLLLLQPLGQNSGNFNYIPISNPYNIFLIFIWTKIWFWNNFYF